MESDCIKRNIRVLLRCVVDENVADARWLLYSKETPLLLSSFPNVHAGQLENVL